MFILVSSTGGTEHIDMRVPELFETKKMAKDAMLSELLDNESWFFQSIDTTELQEEYNQTGGISIEDGKGDELEYSLELDENSAWLFVIENYGDYEVEYRIFDTDSLTINEEKK